MRTLVLTFLVAGSCLAGVVLDDGQCLPLVQDGGGWSTAVTIVNLEPKPSRFELNFRPAKGLPDEWAIGLKAIPGMEVAGPMVRGTLAVGGSVTIETTGAGPAMARGYALLFGFAEAKFGMRAVVRKGAGDPGSLLLHGVAEREDVVRLPFDNSNGASTTMVWVSETPFALVEFSVTGADGKEILHDQLQFYANGPITQELFRLEERYPQLAGARGVVNITTSYPNAGFYDQLFFSPIAIHTEATGLSFVQDSLSTTRWKPSRY